MAQRRINIDPLSVSSLYLEILSNNTNLGQATGFPIQVGDSFYLVSNRRVVNHYDQQRDLRANTLNVIHHSSQRLGNWVVKSESLVNQEGNARWLGHQNPDIDVALLELLQVQNDIAIHPFNLELENTNMMAEPAMAISIIGFPLGIATGGIFPIWKTGHIASDPDLDFQNLPRFLIDATTRGGMSGSPVVLRSNNFRDREGNQVLAAGTTTRFMGVYSGRVNAESEIGFVWRPHVIQEILEGAGIL